MNRSLAILASLAVVASATAQTGTPAWAMYGGNYLHRATAPAPVQNLNSKLWSTPVDLNPQYSGGALLIHYGSPVITHNNVICVPVKTGATDGWKVEGRDATTGVLLYTQTTDYSVPNYQGLDWTPVFGPSLSPDGRLYVPAAGGTIIRRDNPESSNSTTARLVFYGSTIFNSQQSLMSQNVKICTPLTFDAAGNVYFGFVTFGNTMDRSQIGLAHLVSGFARISAAGVGSWVSCTSILQNTAATHVQFNCAPAISADNKLVYFAVKKTGGGGYLVGLDTQTLVLRAIRKMVDPSTGNDALVTDQSSGTPMIGSTGDVYFGVLGNPHARHNGRGFMLHFDKMLLKQKPSGSFGWDNTPSLIPASSILVYSGNSPELLVTKYNNYAGFGTGDGVNRIALLDPNNTAIDPISGVPMMKEIRTVVGVTPDAPDVLQYYPNAVREWCINNALIDLATQTALVNSEDGHLYSWNLQNGVLSPGILLDGPLGQAYTPTFSGPTGIVYAINNGKLFAVGN